jgi:hypothetical protein
MKTFNNVAAQGDVLFERIEKLPNNVTQTKAGKKGYVVSHSETGHAHVIKESPSVKMFSAANDNMIAYLVVDNTGCVVEHTRNFDTHAPLKFSEGIYKVIRQREYTPEGWRVAQD